MKYIIYKITINDYIYIGSTRDFNQRKITHKSNCTNPKVIKFKTKVYQLIREAGGWAKCEMIPIEEYDCEGQLQARIREEYWRREYNANMNQRCAYISPDDKKIKDKLWACEKQTCECGGKYTTQNKSIHYKTKKHMGYLETQNLVIL
jgi:hypothetical protein